MKIMKLSIKKLFEASKKRSKKSHFSKLILTFKNNIEKTWEIIKDSIGKGKCNNQNFPKKVIVDNTATTDEPQIAENFNKFFTEIGPKLAKEIETSTIKFEDYLEQCNTILPDNPVSINELKDAFFPLQINKSPGYDGISFNVVKHCFVSLHKPLLHIFNLSIQKWVLPDQLKIAKVTPLYKNNDEINLGNYRPISVLLCFSKILE